jgi:hypothetical protein
MIATGKLLLTKLFVCRLSSQSKCQEQLRMWNAKTGCATMFSKNAKKLNKDELITQIYMIMDTHLDGAVSETNWPPAKKEPKQKASPPICGACGEIFRGNHGQVLCLALSVNLGCKQTWHTGCIDSDEWAKQRKMLMDADAKLSQDAGGGGNCSRKLSENMLEEELLCLTCIAGELPKGRGQRMRTMSAKARND